MGRSSRAKKDKLWKISPWRQALHRGRGLFAKPGSLEWLIATELKFGGKITGVPRNKVSPKDHRSKEQIAKGGMTGGDRMYDHGYGESYARFLQPLVETGKKLTLAEFGILKGTGLAIWCELFQDSRILGLDIDLGIIQGNMQNLKNLGAFKHNSPELYEYDQLLESEAYLNELLKGDKIDVCIDDGLHSFNSILTTMKSVLPLLADKFVYFIEDNKNVHTEIRKLYPQFNIENKGELTIVYNK